jgi:uncharacterized protein (DUF2132 family)
MNDDLDKKKAANVSNDPLHGVTLETMLTKLVERHGWEGLAERIAVRCFMFEPSIKSSLAFLRKTPWARKKIEDWYAYDARRNMFKKESPPSPESPDSSVDSSEGKNTER